MTILKNGHPIILLVLIPRIFGHLILALVVSSSLHDKNPGTLVYVIVWLQAIIWPFLALFFSSRSKDPKSLEFKFILVDPFLIGCWMAYINFSLWPTIMFSIDITAACLSLGGLRLGAKSILCNLSGMFVVILFHGLHFEMNASATTNLIAIMCFFIFNTILGLATYQRNKSSKRTRSDLKSALSELDHINKILQESSSSLKLDSVMQILIDSLLENVFKFDLLTLQTIENDSSKLIYKIIYDPGCIFPDELRSQEVNLNSKSLAGTVFKSHEYQYINKIELDNEFTHDIKLQPSFHAQSCLIFPVIIKNKAIGIISIYSRKPLQLEQKSIDTVQNYIKQISLIINNAILYEQVKDKRLEISKKNMQLESVSKHLAKYIPPQLFDKIMHGEADININAKKKFLTIFFSDIVSFTEMSDRMESEKLTVMLNIYFDSMARIAIKYGGTVDKYIGDSVMVFFGDPVTEGIKEDAIKCALMAAEMNKEIKQLNSIWQDHGILENIRIRIGIHTGYCAVGNFGSAFRMDYTIVGSAVNFASRLMTSAEPDEIIVSDDTYLLIKDVIPCKKRPKIKIKGITKSVKSYIINEDLENKDSAKLVMNQITCNTLQPD